MLSCLCSTQSSAELVAAGNLRLRHELQMLADAGVIRAPLGGWPLTASDLEAAPGVDTDGDLRAALDRIGGRWSDAGYRWSLGVGGVDTPFGLRGFEELPRERSELSGALDWRGGRIALGLEARFVEDPQDGDEWRLDGSFLGADIGNWFLAAGAVDRWWGPGWDGSLVLSNNARPVPAISFQRRRAQAPNIRGFRWVGPWTTQVFMGQLEADRDHSHARLFGWRFGFKPLPKLEIGLSRTAQWCGAGRPCDFDTFIDLLSGLRDNRGENVDLDEEPGNQLAGLDLRFAFSVLGRPWAVYGQRIGEDERGGRPSAWLSLFGFETWSRLGGGASYRVHAEYTDTACGQHNFGCAYNHGIYTDGYRYRDRAIGHSLDGDGRMLSFGGLLITSAGHSWHVVLRDAEINRGDDVHNSLSPRRRDLLGVELSHTRYFAAGELSLGAGREDGAFIADGADAGETRVFLRWHWKPPEAR